MLKRTNKHTLVYQWQKSEHQACNGLIRCVGSLTTLSPQKEQETEETYEDIGPILSSVGVLMTSDCVLCFWAQLCYIVYSLLVSLHEERGLSSARVCVCASVCMSVFSGMLQHDLRFTTKCQAENLVKTSEICGIYFVIRDFVRGQK